LQSQTSVTASNVSSTGLTARVATPLAYAGWWVTGAILWLVERRDRAIRFHAAQALAAFGIIAAAIAVFGGLALAALTFLPAAFGPLVWAAAITWAAGVVLWLVVMWKAASGHVWRIPIAAALADRLSADRPTD
jgi:uncharacterized membrane protein